MPSQSSQPVPSLDALRELLVAHGVHPTDADLAGVLGFLESILPELGELERQLPTDTSPAGLFLPEREP